MKKIRRYRYQRGVTRALWRQPLTWLVIIVMLLVGTGLSVGFSEGKLVKTKVQLAKASLKSADLVFTASQKPKLALTLPKHHKSLSEILIPRASADTAAAPVIDVTYKGGDAYVPVQATPTDSGYDITVSPNQSVRPGVYQISVKGMTEDGQPYVEKTSFAWGVLAVNSDQATYTPGQTVNLAMAVLDSKGHTKCGLVLNLTVTDPSGQQTNLPATPAKECQGDTFINVSDYTAQYTTTTEPGTYKVQFGLHDSPYHIDDSFQVVNKSDFTIQRTGATRFNPNYEYRMHLHVNAIKTFKGSVVETLSDSRFVVTDKGGATETRQGNKVTLTWSVDWQAGHSYELGYAYNPPRQSPSFFTVGPAKFVNSYGTTAYQEGRGWSLAGDSAITLVKQTGADTANAQTSLYWNSAVTSTAGNTLILVGGVPGATDAGRYIDQVCDSTWTTPATCGGTGTNSWVYSTRVATNPPATANTAGTITSSFIVAYARNANAVTSVTTRESTGANINQGWYVYEFSGIDTNQLTFGNVTQGDGTTLVASINTADLALNTCDVPTTDELMGQGEWFCKFSDSYLVIAAGMGGNTTWTLSSGVGGGWTQLSTVLINGTANRIGTAYVVTSASNTYNATFGLSPSKSASTATFAMGQDITGTVREQALYK